MNQTTEKTRPDSALRSRSLLWDATPLAKGNGSAGLDSVVIAIPCKLSSDLDCV